MTEWEWHFDKLQHGLTFNENNPDVSDTSENENCNKKLIQNDAGSSQDKSYNRHKAYSLDECAKNTVKGLRAIPEHLNIDKGKMLDIQPDSQKKIHEIINRTEPVKTEPQMECQSLCLCSHENVWDSEKENVIELAMWKKCDHCKRHHKLCLNYNSENNSSSWADMMEENLKWNEQQNLDDENQEATHNIES